MTANLKGLGKGFNQIFGSDVSNVLDAIQNGEPVSTEINTSEPARISVNEIRPNPYQPRKVFDETALEELAASIREHGVFTPILVKKSIQGYELIAGERRLRASRLANQTTIPAIIVDFDDKQMMEISLLENIQRENLNAIEEAKAYDQLLKTLHYTQEQLAARVGKSREHVANLLRLLRLPDEVSQLVADKKLSMGHARALLPLKDKKLITQVADQAINESWSVRMIEARVRTILEQKEKEKTRLEKMSKKAKYDADFVVHLSPEEEERHEKEEQENMFLREACRNLEEHFQTPVKIRSNSIVIRYEDNRDLTRILELLGLTEE